MEDSFISLLMSSVMRETESDPGSRGGADTVSGSGISTNKKPEICNFLPLQLAYPL